MTAGAFLASEEVPMRIFLMGGTGLVGTRLVRRLLDRNDQLVLLTRRPEALVVQRSRNAQLAPAAPGNFPTAPGVQGRRSPPGPRSASRHPAGRPLGDNTVPDAQATPGRTWPSSPPAASRWGGAN